MEFSSCLATAVVAIGCLTLGSSASAQTPPGPQCVLDHDGDPVMKYLSGGDLREVEIWTGAGDHRRVWIAEDGGRIRFYDSDDGVWIFQSTPSANALLDIFFLADGETGWAVGKGGVVLHTTDHGDNWTRLDPSYDNWTSNNLWGIYFFDDGEGWLVGDGVFFHSEEGNFGETWNGDAVFTASCGGHPPEAYEFYAIDFIQEGSAIRGVVSAEPGAVFYTDDGESWTPSTCTMGSDLSNTTHPFEGWDVAFEPNPASIASARVYVCGGKGTHNGAVYLSTIGGGGWNNWTQILEAEPSENEPGSTFYGIVALPNGAAVACGYAGAIYRRDSSETWHDETQEGFTFPLNGVDSDGASKLWCVGSMGFLKKSTDGGDSWTEDVPYTDIVPSRLSVVDFASESTGWTVGQFHRITKTIDGGCTWEWQYGGPNPESAEPTSCVTGMDFASSSAGIAVGCDKWVVYTTNGGTTWTKPTDLNVSATTTLMDVEWNGSSHFYVVGDGGVVGRSTNGDVWEILSGPSGNPTLMSIDFYSSTKAFVVGYTGSDINENGVGRAWRLTTSPTVIWEEVSPTFNGGAEVGLDGGRSLRGVDARVVNNQIEAYACGNYGVFLKYNRITAKFEPLAGVYECDATTGEVSAPPLTNLRLKSVAMVPSDTKVLASTFSENLYPEESGRIVYFDGSSWSLIESQTTRSIVSWSFPSSDIGYGVGIGSQTETDGSVADSVIVIWRP